MTLPICRIVCVLALFGTSVVNAQDAATPVEEYVFLGQHVDMKYGKGVFTAAQQLVPALIEASEKGRVKIHGVWIDRADVMNMDQAVKYYTVRLDSDPSNVPHLLRRGMAFQHQEKYWRAIQDYDAAIEMDAGSAMAYERRGTARFARASKSPATAEPADFEAAISDLSEAVRLASPNSLALIERGNIRCYLKDHDAAIQDYTESIRLNPSVPWTYAWRARSLQAKGEYEAALQDCSRAISIDQTSPLYLVGRGNVLRSMKKYDDAIKDYDKAISLNAAFSAAFFDRAATFLMMEKYEAAIADFSVVIRQAPPAVDSLRNRAIAFTALGQLENALDDFNAAVAIDPSNAEVFYLRGKILGQQKLYAAAIQDFTESLRLDDTLEQNYRTRGLVYRKLGNYENVVRDFSEFIRRKPTNRWILNDLAWIHATSPDSNIRNGTKAVELAKRACEVSEWKNSAYIDTLAAAYAETSDWEAAISTQERALKMVTTEAEKTDYAGRLSLYQKKEPFRVPQPKGE